MNKPAATRARDNWGEAPDWVLALATYSDAHSQNKAGKLIGYSGATVCLVLGNSYPGDMATVEKAVRGALMNETVDCPVLGEIPANRCLKNQQLAFSSANAQRIQLYKACHGGCPHNKENANA